MSNEMELDNILDDFAMETPVCPDTLRRYIEKHPSLVLELTDLYHELLMVDLANKVGVNAESESTATVSAQSGQVVANALSGSCLRELANDLGMPRDFVAGFRDRKIRFGSIPGSVLLKLSRVAKVNLHLMIEYLQGSATTPPQIAHKAKGKPKGSSQVDYDEFIAGLGLDENEFKALERMIESDGQD